MIFDHYDAISVGFYALKILLCFSIDFEGIRNTRNNKIYEKMLNN